jgi:hypothetical protein
MDDLEDRTSKENIPLLPTMDASKQRHDSTAMSQSDPHNPSWLFGFLVRKPLQQSTQTEMAPLARKRPMEGTRADDSFDLVVSTSVLQAEELAELSQLRLSTPGCNQKLAIVVREHPREAFLALTFLLGMCVYLYSRSMQDNVH